MKQPQIIPALADLRQDIAGAIPVDLIRAWVESDRSAATHARLLAPFLRRGTLVKSDSAGLSRLSVSRPLIEVLKLVNDPKEIIARHGIAIGGEPIGVWIADDTEMFYPEHVSEAQILDAMAAAQRANSANVLQVGLALHRGEFFHIGNGMYGDDAELVEELAENATSGGEIWITEPRTRVQHQDLVCTTEPLAACEYPAPFSKDFLRELKELDLGTNTRGGSASDALAQKYAREVCVVLVRVFHEHQPLLLDHVSGFVSANSDISRIAHQYNVTKVKANGQLGIFTCALAEEAVQFARAIRDELVAEEWSANACVTRGSVFLFPLENGDTEIAGGPVNVASKLAEDTDLRDTVIVEQEVVALLGEHSAHVTKNAQPFTVTRSGVELSGVTL